MASCNPTRVALRYVLVWLMFRVAQHVRHVVNRPARFERPRAGLVAQVVERQVDRLEGRSVPDATVVTACVLTNRAAASFTCPAIRVALSTEELLMLLEELDGVVPRLQARLTPSPLACLEFGAPIQRVEGRHHLPESRESPAQEVHSADGFKSVYRFQLCAERFDPQVFKQDNEAHQLRLHRRLRHGEKPPVRNDRVRERPILSAPVEFATNCNGRPDRRAQDDTRTTAGHKKARLKTVSLKRAQSANRLGGARLIQLNPMDSRRSDRHAARTLAFSLLLTPHDGPAREARQEIGN